MIGFIARRRARGRAARPARLRRRPRPDRGGMATTAAGFRRPLDRRMTRRSTSSSAAPPSIPATRRRSRATSASRDGAISLVTHCHKDRGAAGRARGRRRARADALPRLHRPAHALGPALVRRPAPDAEARAGLHDRGDQPGRPRAGSRRARAAGGAPGVPAAARRQRARRHGRGRRSRSTSTRSTQRGRRSRSCPRSATARCASSCSAAGGSRRPPRAARRCGARSASASRPARACSRSGSSTCPARTRATDELVAVAEEAAAFGVPLVPHVRNEGHGLLEAVGEMIDVARRSGAPLHVSHLKSLADESLIEPLLELLDERRRRARRHLRPVPVRRRQHAAREHPARAGRRRAARTGRCGRSAAATTGAASRCEIANGLPGWENILGTLGPEQIEIANAAPPNEDAVGRTLAEIARRARQRSGRDGPRPDERVGPRRDDGAALRLRRRRARRSRATRSSSSARTASSARGRIRASTPRRRASSAASRSGTGCCRSRRRSRG